MTKKELQEKAKNFESKLKRHPMSRAEIQIVLVDFVEYLEIHGFNGQIDHSKCYHYNHEWKSDGEGGMFKYCNDCKCHV
jgi:hypothetical protein